MDIKIYIGGHQATTTHFIKALEANKSTLAAHKTVFIPPIKGIYASAFKATKAIRKMGNPTFIQQEFLQQFDVPEDTKTLVFVDDRTIGTNLRVFEKELFFPKPGGFIKQIQTIFNEFPLRLFIETRDIATFLPACYYSRIFDNILGSLDEFIGPINLEIMRWSSFIDRAQGRGEVVPATTWRYEDYPFIWRDVLGAVTKIKTFQDFTDPTEPLDLNVKLQSAVLFYKYAQQYPISSEEEFETLKKLFLERDLKTPKKLTSPNWSAEQIQTLTHAYEDDWYYIERMEKVETIQLRSFTQTKPESG